MIDKILPAITAELNSFLQLKAPHKDSIPQEGDMQVVLSELKKADGRVDIEEFKLIASLINIQQERTNLNVSVAKSPKRNPPVQLNLYVLFTADFPGEHYVLALKYISYIIGFFQGKPIFTPQNTPQLPGGVERINAEIVNLDMEELNNLWGSLGGQHSPSVVYKLRMISVAEDYVIG